MGCKKLEVVSESNNRKSKICSGACDAIQTTRNLPIAALKPDQIEMLLKEQHAPDLSAAKLLKDSSLIYQKCVNSMDALCRRFPAFLGVI